MSNDIKGISKDLLLQVARMAAEKATGDTKLQAAEAVAGQATTPSKPALNSLVSSGLKLAGKALPHLAGMIPVAGPVLKTILTTLNDDEWFGEFKGVGVTPNEFLQMKSYDGGNTFSLTSGLTEIDCRINDTDAFYENFMPSVLAYVRNKTNNVLADDTSKYTDAFHWGSALYSLYYAGMKYVKLSEHQPLNIPLLSKVVGVLDPVIYNQFRGVVESLGDFLRTTVRLPYAWLEYLRWRYGTTFYSENTGKPGLIMYDPVMLFYGSYETSADVLKRYVDEIDKIRAAYISTGRAGADLKLAYDAHQIRFDVDNAHHDAKEFNLRTNLTFGLQGTPPKFPADADNAFVFIDSRLDQSAAIQAVTISTSTGIQPIVCKNMYHALYFAEPFTVKVPVWYDVEGTPTLRSVAIPAGWNTFQSRMAAAANAVNAGGYLVPGFVVSGKDEATGLRRFKGIEVFVQNIDDKIPLPMLTDGTDVVFGAFGPDSVLTTTFENSTLHDLADATLATFVLGYCFSLPCLTALQFHNTGILHNLAGNLCSMTPLAYDMAYVSRGTIQSIQRTAMRNLTRGDYKAKTQPTTNPDIKAAVADVEKTAIQDVKSQMAASK